MTNLSLVTNIFLPTDFFTEQWIEIKCFVSSLLLFFNNTAEAELKKAAVEQVLKTEETTAEPTEKQE